MSNKSKKQCELFEELACPDENGVSRWVSKEEFVDKYQPLYFSNGWSWGRTGEALESKYKLDTKRKGNTILEVRTIGFNTGKVFKQNIRKDIKDTLKTQNCVMLGIKGDSVNTKIEIDHKDGRKNDDRVSDIKTQRIEDFQPLCKAANDAKRQICKHCEETNKRWDAKNLKGNPYSFYDGDENYSEDLGCVGCYQYDPVEYRKSSCKRICEEATKYTTDFIMNKLYGDD